MPLPWPALWSVSRQSPNLSSISRTNGSGRTVAALIDNGASQPQKIRPGQAEPGRSGAVRTSADAITAALAPAGRTPTVLGNSGRRLVGARYAIIAARGPAHRAPLAGLSRLR